MSGITPSKTNYQIVFQFAITMATLVYLSQIISIINKTGAVKNTEQIAIDRKPDYDGLCDLGYEPHRRGGAYCW